MKSLRFTLLATTLLFSLLYVSSCSKAEDDNKKDDNNKGGTDSLTVACINVSSSNVAIGDTVQFTSCSTNATTHLWNFGDGSVSSEQNPKHAYNTGGTFMVKLITGNDSGSDTASQNIIVPPGRNDFLGYYMAYESCANTGTNARTYIISAASGSNDEILIEGLINSFSGPIVGIVDGYNITIPMQNAGAVVYSGSGSINTALNRITINFTVTYDGDTNSCNSVASK